MIRRKWIRELAYGSFCDAGGLWGIVNENISDAVDAKSRTLLDKFPLTDPLWGQMRQKLAGIEYEELSANICDVKRKWDVVSCGGVIYHYPKPEELLTMLKNMANKYLIITTTFTKPVVSNSKGKIEIAEALHMPDIDEATREVVKEDWKEFLGNKPASGLVYVDDWNKNVYEHWWWLFTETYLDSLFKKINLDIVQKAIEGKTISYLLRCRKFLL